MPVLPKQDDRSDSDPEGQVYGLVRLPDPDSDPDGQATPAVIVPFESPAAAHAHARRVGVSRYLVGPLVFDTATDPGALSAPDCGTSRAVARPSVASPAAARRGAFPPQRHFTATVTIDLPDVGSVCAEVPTLAVLGGDGLVLSQAPWRTSASGEDGPVGPVGLLLCRRSLVPVALSLAGHHPAAGPIAVWPEGVPAELTAVALAVGCLLRKVRPAGGPAPVMCAVRPPMRRTRLVIRHRVTTDLDGEQALLTVWEVPLPGRGASEAARARPVVRVVAA
ncbi:hypothetical protein [Pseudofrankia sp. BMG5.36]|uniref:hypothetical protein n=1 Tax=Pseudofrankia sp. BMG5.36 TaxID=1834512 RepID=UPI0008D9BB89|nr:hypothetical protein [Pseudofrankia sp. BMG5.36]OHV64170.1 hypothetical protein BCD48_37600 [Pseudofrankia sp. BMG5.36]